MDEELILNQIETETDKNEYDIIKEDFEKNNFKIDDPLLYATIGENLILRNRNEFINKYEKCFVSTSENNFCDVLGVPLGLYNQDSGPIERESDFVIKSLKVSTYLKCKFLIIHDYTL